MDKQSILILFGNQICIYEAAFHGSTADFVGGRLNFRSGSKFWTVPIWKEFSLGRGMQLKFCLRYKLGMFTRKSWKQVIDPFNLILIFEIIQAQLIYTAVIKHKIDQSLWHFNYLNIYVVTLKCNRQQSVYTSDIWNLTFCAQETLSAPFDPSSWRHSFEFYGNKFIVKFWFMSILTPKQNFNSGVLMEPKII